MQAGQSLRKIPGKNDFDPTDQRTADIEAPADPADTSVGFVGLSRAGFVSSTIRKTWKKTSGGISVRDGAQRRCEYGETGQKAQQQLGNYRRKQKRTTPGDHSRDNRETRLRTFRTAWLHTWL